MIRLQSKFLLTQPIVKTFNSNPKNANVAIKSLRRQYTTALTRKVSPRLADALSMETPTSPIQMEKALSQHENYVSILQNKVGLDTVEIDADDNYPDCVFIEDTAVVISNVAVITNIGASSRKGEVDAVKEVLSNLGLKIHDMRTTENNSDNNHKMATLDGGDVLYPIIHERNKENGKYDIPKGGHHLFVGVSSRTNLQGVEYLAEKFYPHVQQVIPVDIATIAESTLHLKSIVSHIDERTILVPEGSLGNKIIRSMDLYNLGYDVIRLKDIAACNVVRVNDHLLAPPTKCTQTKKILKNAAKERNIELVDVDTSEFAKVDGALTCKSILF